MLKTFTLILLMLLSSSSYAESNKEANIFTSIESCLTSKQLRFIESMSNDMQKMEELSPAQLEQFKIGLAKDLGCPKKPQKPQISKISPEEAQTK